MPRRCGKRDDHHQFFCCQRQIRSRSLLVDFWLRTTLARAEDPHAVERFLPTLNDLLDTAVGDQAGRDQYRQAEAARLAPSCQQGEL